MLHQVIVWPSNWYALSMPVGEGRVQSGERRMERKRMQIGQLLARGINDNNGNNNNNNNNTHKCQLHVTDKLAKLTNSRAEQTAWQSVRGTKERWGDAVWSFFPLLHIDLVLGKDTACDTIYQLDNSRCQPDPAQLGLRSSVRGSPRAFLITRRADKFPWLGQRSWHLGSHRKSGHNRRAARKSQTNDYNSCQFLALSLSPRCDAGLIDGSPDSDAVVDDAIDCLACVCLCPCAESPLSLSLSTWPWPCAMPIVCLANHKAFCVLRGSARLGLAWLSCCYFNQQQCAGCRSMWSPSRSCPIIADPAAAYTKPQQQQQ